MKAPHSLTEFLTATTFSIGTNEQTLPDVHHGASDLAHVSDHDRPNAISMKDLSVLKDLIEKYGSAEIDDATKRIARAIRARQQWVRETVRRVVAKRITQ